MYPLPVYNGNTRARKMGPPRAFSSTRGNQPSMMFDALQGTIVLGRGGVAPTFTNATVRTITDQDLFVRQVLSGEARFGGFKRVQNLIAKSEDVSHASWSIVGSPTRTATSITFTASAGDKVYTQILAGATGSINRIFAFRVLVYTDSGTKDFRLGLTQSGVLDMTTAALTATTTPTVFAYEQTVASAAGTNLLFLFQNDAVGIAGKINVFYIQAEEITGQSIQRPGEYVSSGVLSAPYHGAGVDAVKYFGSVISNTGVAIGDSFTSAGSYPARINTTHKDAVLSSSGTGGNTLTLMEARFAADVVASSPKFCIIMGGINDISGASSDPNSTMQAKLQSMVSMAVAAGIRPILNTIAPWKNNVNWTAARQTYTDTYNAWIRLYAASGNYPIFDMYAALGDTSDPRALLAAYDSGDGLHPSAPGYIVIGAGLMPIIPSVGGTPISSAILGGYLPEPAATDLLTARADARDMTTANWTLGATMTRARTSVGADGVANKATRLTGGAVAATNIITTTITAAASSRTYSVLIKRVTGTGAIGICQDGATFTDISGLINSSTYTLVQINASQLNAQLGIQISVNGDAIDADWNQFSAGNLTGLINSRIPDTITTRNADVLTYATTGWLNAAAGTLYAEWFNPNNITSAGYATSINDGTTNNKIYMKETTTPTIIEVGLFVGGAAQYNLQTAVLTAAAIAKADIVYQLNDFAGWGNNAAIGTDAVGTIPTVTQIEVGCHTSVGQLGHYIRKVAYYPTRMVNESAKALTV